MLELLAAAIIQLPTTDVRTAWSVLQQATPAIKEPVAGARIRAFVEPSGKVTNCEVISRAGKQDSADALCRAFEGRVVTPATDIDGSAISGYIEMTLWFRPSRDTKVPALPDVPPDAQLTVKSLPDGVSDPFRLTVGLIIDQTGAIAACGPVDAEHEAMVAAACQAVKVERFPVVRGPDGKPARYVRSYDVAFATGSPAPDGA